MHGASWLVVVLSAVLCGSADVSKVVGDKGIAVTQETTGSACGDVNLERCLLGRGSHDEVSEVASDKGNAATQQTTGSASGDVDIERSILGRGATDEVSQEAIQKEIASLLETTGSAGGDVDLEPRPLGTRPKDVDVYLNTAGLVSKYGYPIETHEVETEDGFILTMFRIPYGKKSPLKDGERKPAVLLQHGLMNSADDWVIIGPERAFAYILADAGYDVWLGNTRGNWYSHKHLRYSEESPKYWDFSWHENGIYDMPAQIDHVLNSTGHKQIYYVGHSMGTTMFYVGMSLKTEYNQKIRAMFSLAPIAYMNQVRSPLFRVLARLTPIVQTALKQLGAKKFTPCPELIKLIQPEVCKGSDAIEILCTNVVFLTCGFDNEQFFHEKLEAISAHIPAGSSMKQFIHYAQGIEKGHFRQYDHGVKGNMERYGKATPPDYNLANVTAPVYLFYGANDWLSGPTDVDRLHNQLGNSKLKQNIALQHFNHLDFMYAKDAYDLVYKQVLDLMNSYEKGTV